MLSELLQIWQQYRKEITLILVTSVATLLFTKALPTLLAGLQRLSLLLLAVLTGRRKEFSFERKYLEWLINENSYTPSIPSQVLNPDRVPQQPRLEEIYIHLQLAHTSTSENSVEVTMPELVKMGSRTVILGDPGLGKTTLLRYLCLTYAKLARSPRLFYRQRRALRSRIATKRGVIPLLIYLNRLSHNDNQLLLAAEDALPESLKSIYPKGYFQRLLTRGKCIVLLDGLDEVSSSVARIDVARSVNSIANSFHRDNTWIITSRIVGYKGQLHSSFITAIVQSLTPDQVKRFVTNWYQAKCKNSGFPADEVQYQKELHDQRARQLINTLKSNPGLSSLATNPMLVSLISLLHSVQIELPENRALLYRDCLGLLADRWDLFRGINTADQVHVTTQQKISILTTVAWSMHNQRVREIRRSEIERIISEHLKKIINQSETQSTDLVLANLEERSGLLITRGMAESGEKIMAFSHLSFQEFLASAALLAQAKSQVSAILSDFIDSWWREPLLLYTAQIDTPLDLITEILEGSPAHNAFENLIVAASCLAEVQVDKNNDLYKTITSEIVLLYSAGRIRSLNHALLKFDKYNALLRHMIRYLQNVPYHHATGLEILLLEARGDQPSVDTIDAFLNLCESAPELSESDLTLIDSICHRRNVADERIFSTTLKHYGPIQFDTEWPKCEAFTLDNVARIAANPGWVSVIPKLPSIASRRHWEADNEANSTYLGSGGWNERTVKQIIMKQRSVKELRSGSLLAKIQPDTSTRDSIEKLLKLLERKEYSKAAGIYNNQCGPIDAREVPTAVLSQLYSDTDPLARALCIMLICRLDVLDSPTERILTDYVLDYVGNSNGRETTAVEPPTSLTAALLERILCRRALLRLGEHNLANPNNVRVLLYCHTSGISEISDIAFDQISGLPTLDNESIQFCLKALDTQEVSTVWTAAFILSASDDKEGRVIKRLLPLLSDREHSLRGTPLSDIAAHSLIQIMTNNLSESSAKSVL